MNKKTTCYAADGSIMWIFEYDEEGYCIKETDYDNDGSYQISERNKNGIYIRTTQYNADDLIIGILERDDDGKVTANIFYEYDENGKKTSERYCDADGNTQYWYAYDENDVWTQYFPTAE